MVAKPWEYIKLRAPRPQAAVGLLVADQELQAFEDDLFVRAVRHVRVTGRPEMARAAMAVAAVSLSRLAGLPDFLPVHWRLKPSRLQLPPGSDAGRSSSKPPQQHARCPASCHHRGEPYASRRPFEPDPFAGRRPSRTW